MTVSSCKKDFPIFSGRLKRLVYLDNAATSQKPKSVIKAETEWYEKHNANIHRGAYALAEEATELFEQARRKVAEFIGAKDVRSVVFTKGTTESINMAAYSWARRNLKSGDTILLTEMEHHANIVPWLMLAQEKKLKIKYWPITASGELARVDYSELFVGVKLLALTHVSNVLGTTNPIEKIIKLAKTHGVAVLIDAAQSVCHLPLDVSRLQPDFLVFSSHKMLGPTGLGVLYVDPKRFKEMGPYQSGGDMITEVGLETCRFKQMPHLLEAGTQPLAQVFALGRAIDYIDKLGRDRIQKHTAELTDYAYRRLSQLPGVKIYGPQAGKRLGLVSFTVDGLHAHDLATLLDRKGICVRAGHHCAMPLHNKLGVAATARLSFGVYNDKRDIDLVAAEIESIIKKWNSSTKKPS